MRHTLCEIRPKGNMTHAYVRAERDDRGVWITVGDDDVEESIWINAVEAKQLSEALVTVFGTEDR